MKFPSVVDTDVNFILKYGGMSQISVTVVLLWSRFMDEWPGWPWLPAVTDHCLDQVVKLTRRGVCAWQSGVCRSSWVDRLCGADCVSVFLGEEPIA